MYVCFKYAVIFLNFIPLTYIPPFNFLITLVKADTKEKRTDIFYSVLSLLCYGNSLASDFYIKTLPIVNYITL